MPKTKRSSAHVVARLLAGAAMLATALSLAQLGSSAGASESLRTLTYQGEQFQVPASWPVFDVSSDVGACVRFNRHAAYLGAATSSPDCPSQVFGASSAIEVEPLTATRLASETKAARMQPGDVAGQRALVSSNGSVSGRIVAAFPQSRVLALISYRTEAGRHTAQSILESFRLEKTAAGTATRTAGTPSASAAAVRAGLTAATAEQPVVGSRHFTGHGFDTCNAPSQGQMAAWKAHSPFGAVGVYIGGPNAACDNVTSGWMSAETAAGWAVFPIYVGLQAPCANQSNMASISGNPTTAAHEGASDAENAVADAESLGVGSGSTIYDDMEAWNTGRASCNRAVLSFVKAWTNKLHADGFKSGLYASLYSGVGEIDSIYGQAGCPDDIYFAYWDGVATTVSSYIPAGDWASGERIKQYSSGVAHYGGVRLDIDRDYLDAQAIGGPVHRPVRRAPAVTSMTPSKAPVGTHVIIKGSGLNTASDVVRFGSVESPSVDVVSSKELIAVAPKPTSKSVKVTVETPAGTASGGVFSYVALAGIAAQPAGGYVVTSRIGNVDTFGSPWHGSGLGRASRFVGVAATKTGYLLTSARGKVYAFHTAYHGALPAKGLQAPVVGIAATASGYLLANSKGHVYGFHTSLHGSLPSGAARSPIVGIAATPTGYLLANAKGHVFGFNTARHGSLAGTELSSPVVGIAARGSGYLLATADGHVYAFDTPYYGSLAGTKLSSPVVGIAATKHGYLLTTANGDIYAFHTAYHGSLTGQSG